MNNQNYKNLIEGFLNNGQNAQTNSDINRITNMMNSNDGKTLANELNRVANDNKSMQNIINQARNGNLNDAAQGLSQIMKTSDGKEIAELFSKLMGE